MVIVVNPLGDFPLNDDWAYGFSVRALVENGQLRFSDWTATNLFGQVMWGALSCLPFGFSFTALRLSTAVLGFVGVLATYGILRELKTPRTTAAIGALTLAFCPIYFALSLTFMNDVPYTAFAISSLYFFLCGVRLDSPLRIAVGLLLAGVTILTRQTGLTLPIAFACTLLAKKGVRTRYLLLALFVVVTGVAIQFAYQALLFKRGLAPAKFNNQIFSLLAETRKHPRPLLRDVVSISFFCVMYIGLFTAPFLPFTVPKSQRDARLSRSTSFLLTIFIAVLLVGGLIWVGKLMPLWGNILDQGGIGPYPWYSGEILRAPTPFWVAVTIVSVVGGVGMLKGLVAGVVALYSRLRKWSVGYHPWPLVLLFSVIAISFAPLSLLGLGIFGFYDRYVIIFVPTIIAVLASTGNKRSVSVSLLTTLVGLGLLTLYGSFSIAATHDYLTLNRTRWKALNDLMHERSIPPSHISGGMDFNGWYCYNQYSKDRTRTWFWVERDDYIVSFNLQDNYAIDRRYPVQRWLPWRQGAGEVIVQRRIAGEPRWE